MIKKTKQKKKDKQYRNGQKKQICDNLKLIIKNGKKKHNIA